MLRMAKKSIDYSEVVIISIGFHAICHKFARYRNSKVSIFSVFHTLNSTWNFSCFKVFPIHVSPGVPIIVLVQSVSHESVRIVHNTCAFSSTVCIYFKNSMLIGYIFGTVRFASVNVRQTIQHVT